MKSARIIRRVAVALLVAGVFLAGCTAAGPEAPTGTMGLMLQLPQLPIGGGTLDYVVLRLEPTNGGESTEYELDVVDHTASTEVDVFPGSWNLEAEVFNTDETLVAEGSGFAVVLPGTTTEVNMVLTVVSGGLDIDLEWDDGPPLYVADVSHRPVSVEIEGIGEYEISGLSRIGWDIEVFEYPVTAERTTKEPGAVSYPDLAMLYLRGTLSEVESLATWDSDDTPRSMTLTLEGRAGEQMRINFYDVVVVASNTDIFTIGPYEEDHQMGGVKIRYGHLELADYTPTFRESSEYFLEAHPGQDTEIEGVDLLAAYPNGVLAAPAPGTNPAFWLPSVYTGEVGYDWGEHALDFIEAFNAVERRAMSIIDLDENGDEIDRINIYECWPASINLFNPRKVYGQSFLVDVFIVGEWVEDA